MWISKCVPVRNVTVNCTRSSQSKSFEVSANEGEGLRDFLEICSEIEENCRKSDNRLKFVKELGKFKGNYLKFDIPLNQICFKTLIKDLKSSKLRIFSAIQSLRMFKHQKTH